MKKLLLATFLFAPAFAHAQTAQRPIFYPSTLRVGPIKTEGNTQTQVIERRTIIVLGFLPRIPSGEVQVQTAPISSEDRHFLLRSETKGGDFNRTFNALQSELLSVRADSPKIKRWDSILKTSWGWGLIPSGPLRAASRYGQMSYCVHVESFTISGTRDGRTLRFTGGFDSYTNGPAVFFLEKARLGHKTWQGNFDITTLPDAKQMEALVDELSDF